MAADPTATLIVYSFLALAVYFLPTIVANTRRHHNRLAIGMLNLLLGVTVVGWIGALVWACTKVEYQPPDPNAWDGILYRFESLFSGFARIGVLARKSLPATLTSKMLAVGMLMATYALAIAWLAPLSW